VIPTILKRSKRPCVAVSGGMDSLVVLDMVRKHRPDIEALVFRADFTPEQWGIIDNLIRLWDLTVVSPLPRTSYFVPNGGNLARVDEYDVNGTVFPVLRDLVHSDHRCSLDLATRFAPLSPLDYDCVFVGTREGDSSEAMGHPLPKAVNRIGSVEVIAPIYYWTDEEVGKAAQGLPYSKEWYDLGDERYDTGNLIACSRCVATGTSDPVECPKAGHSIEGYHWNQSAMLGTFRAKFGFVNEGVKV
jgi:hypothetical protein